MTAVPGADALVIGAGHNGLVAANLLADAGWDVLVLEATGAPGGAVRSGEITAPGYLSDLCSAFYPLGAAAPALRSLHLEEYGLRLRHAPDVLAHLLPDDRAAVINRDPERTAESVERFAAGDGDRWRATYADWQRLAPALLDSIFSPFPPVRSGARLARRLGLADLIRLGRRALMPVRALGDELFRGEGAKLLLAGNALHTDLPPEAAGGAAFGWLLAMLGQQYGFPVAAGGAQRLTDALVARLAARGGQIEYGTWVDRVAVAHRRAVGVRTTDGRVWRARRAVLADVPAPTLYLDLVGPSWLPPRLVEDLAHFRWDGATVKIDWALSGPVPWRNAEVAGAGTVHMGADLAGLTRFAAALACDEVPTEPFLILGQMTTADPARSPAGTETLWAYTHLPHRAHWDAEQIAAHADYMQAAVERHAPGLGQRVVARRVFGPADLERQNPGLVGGTLGGGTSAPYQQLFLRPVPGLGRADTPVDRLYLANCSAHPGPGVHGTPGANAARAALARDRAVTGALYAAAVRTAHGAIYRPTRTASG